jgi:hypothetical protein
MSRTRIQQSSVIARSAEVAFREVDGETVMMSVQAGKYYSLDAVGTRIWALLEQPRTVAEICSILVEEFEVTPDQCQADVLAFLERLAADELVTCDTPAD